MPDHDDLYIDANGCLSERVWLGGQEVVVHYDDIPEQDLTIHQGIPVTTPLRTLIDLAPEVSADHLERMVKDCLERQLFTLEGAFARLSEDDMRTRPGARLLRRVLDDCAR